MPKSINFYTPIFFLTCAILLLSSCSSTEIREDAIHFHTRITSSGLKHFQVSIILPPAQRQPKRRDGNNNRSSSTSPEEQAARRAEKLLIETSAAKILETQFCRDGYWFLGNNFYNRKVFIRGECNETATNEDREKW